MPGRQPPWVVSNNLRARRKVRPRKHEQPISTVGQGGNTQAAFIRNVVL